MTDVLHPSRASRPCLVLVGFWVVMAASGQANADCTLVADVATGRALMQEGLCDQRVTPASTFKVAISLMGYDAAILQDEHHPELPFKEGYPDWLPSWRSNTDPTGWIKNSVVWYSQQITQKLGAERFAQYAAAFDYGNADVSGDPGKHNGLTHAWLSSSLRISPLEQLSFLRRAVRGELPVSRHALEMTSRITKMDNLPGGWDLHGKTGSGFPLKPDGTQDTKHGFGWFVGWANRNDRSIVFAHLIQDEAPQPVSAGYRARDSLLQNLPALLNQP